MHLLRHPPKKVHNVMTITMILMSENEQQSLRIRPGPEDLVLK